MSKTAVATRDDSAELAVPDDVAAAIAAAQQAEYGDEPLQTPILKIGQGLTKEVENGDASVGEFINTLTGEGVGDAVEFVVGYYNRGRFASGPRGSAVDGRAFTAYGSTIPPSWEPLVGEEWVGVPFSEYPEAEEEYKRRVNDKEIEWGHGPLVSTTHNYTGLLVNEDGEPEPVRLSLKRIDMPAHRKLNTLLRAVLRNKPTWDKVVKLTTTSREFSGRRAYTIDPAAIKFVRDTTPEERAYAAEVARAVMSGRATSVEVEDAPTAPPANDGGLAV